MRLLPLILCLLASMHAMAAEGIAVQKISMDARAQPPGYPASPSPRLAIAGKPLRIILLNPSASADSPVRIDRITATSRVQTANATAAFHKEGWTCEWTPPLTRGIVTYEIRFLAHKDFPLLVEVRDPDWIKQQTALLGNMQWQAAGLNPQEMSALATLGLRKIEVAARDANATPVLRMTANDSLQSRRQVTWDDKHHDLVVWRNGVAAQDADVRAPRWWISPDALASDQGLIRFLDLFTEPPHAP